ncbi:MAG: C69 family dipeptidase, partial [Candidatus Cryptobacteroides sp.]|nr:C69 family dipeptidase [Candidatus Cryptobacteroides sp.]
MASAMALTQQSNACTNIIVTRGASKDNSAMVSYAADSHWLYGELYFHPAMDWKDGTMLNIVEWDTSKPLGQIPQVPHTYKTVGNMNEHQLIIGETTWGGRLELMDSTAIMDYGSLIYVALQRARTAREAIQVIVDLANEYGYASEGESFSIADKNEAWVMDLIGKGVEMKDGKNVNKGLVWVARRIP